MENVQALSVPVAPILPEMTEVQAAEKRKPFAWHLSRALSRWLYSVLLFIGAVMVVFPQLFARFYATSAPYSHWKGLIALVAVEVLIVDYICKRHIKWPRPHPPYRNGFPSGHSTFSFGIATMLAFLYPVLSPIFFVLAGAVAWARFYLQAHCLYQVCGGGFIGMIIGAIMAFVK